MRGWHFLQSQWSRVRRTKRAATADGSLKPGEIRPGLRGWLRAVCVGALLSATAPACLAGSNDQFVAPKPEELSMTSMPGYPGVAAVVLYREQIDDTPLHSRTIYERIKVLNEDGKKYANVVLAFRSSSFFSSGSDFDSTIKDITARTIHADGKIIPFTGKPYEREVEKVKGEKTKQKILTLPDVQVGSILEYRYTKEYATLYAPDWILQGDLFVKAAHYRWTEGESDYYSTTWFPVLPPGVQLVKSRGDTQFDLNMADIPPLPTDDYLPPSSSFVYRVMFNYIEQKSGEEYWKVTANDWAKNVNDFLHGNTDIKSKTQELAVGAKTQDEALKKIYAYVMSLENTSYTRDYDKKEDKAHGKREVRDVTDVFANKRGGGVELTLLFVSMARAAGMKAYVMVVPDRSDDLFLKGWLTLQQFDAAIALVNVDGKDMFFDPGDADCPYGELPWQYTMMTGLRQMDSGGGFASTPSVAYNRNREERVGDLAMDASGVAEGTVKMTYYGSPALVWRHVARSGDKESFRKDLKDTLEEELPKGFEATVTDVKQLADYENPLVVFFHVHGPLASKAGKRLLVPSDLFEAQETTTFTKTTRQFPVYFHYPEVVADAVRVKFPDGMTVESAPDKTMLKLEESAAYSMSITTTGNSFTTQRNHSSRLVIVPAEKYAALRDFYSKYEAKDQESVVLNTVH